MVCRQKGVSRNGRASTKPGRGDLAGSRGENPGLRRGSPLPGCGYF